MFESLRQLAIVFLLFALTLPAFAARQMNSERLAPPLVQSPDEQFSTSDVRFQSRSKDYTTYFTPSGLILAGFSDSQNGPEYFELALQLHNPQKDVEITTLNPMLASNDQWLTSLPDYARIKYANVYRGIDMVCQGNADQVEMQFVVAPGANIRQIRLKSSGTNKIEATPDGGLLFVAGSKTIRMSHPVAYQTSESGSQNRIDVRYVLNSLKEISLRVGAYDARRILIVNP